MKKTHAIFVLDRSGSMESCRDATIDGFNEQLNSLAATEGKVRISCLQFDTNVAASDIETLYERVKVADAPRLTRETYEPRGGTPMLDAVGRAIALADGDTKSDALLMIIVSDGQENSSRVETYETVAAKIKERTAKGNWTFAYVGANQDLADISKRMNIPIGNTMAYHADPAGTRAMYASSASASANFTNSDRAATADYFSGAKS